MPRSLTNFSISQDRLAALLVVIPFCLTLPQASAHTPSPQVSIELKGNYRYISANGIPDHDTGDFPNPGNPNAIGIQQYRFRMPLTPNLAERITPVRGYWLGIALNGIPFEPDTGETWRGDRQWRYEALGSGINLGLDHHHAHVQPSGAYHYHGIPTGLIENKVDSTPETDPILIGYAADGFPIYVQASSSNGRSPAFQPSYQLKTGDRAPNQGPHGSPDGPYDGTFSADYEYQAGSGDLDECNGRTGITAEYPAGIYHYYATPSFPYLPRCLRGQPDASFKKQRHPGSGGNRSRPGRPPGGGPPGGRPRPPLHSPHHHF